MKHKDVFVFSIISQHWYGAAVFALRFENLLARNSSMKIFKHEKEEKLAGPTGNFAGPAPFLVAKGLGPALNAKTGAGNWNHSSWKTRIHLSGINNTMVTDDLATQGARSSADPFIWHKQYHGAGNWNHSSWKTRIHLYGINNTMVTDDMATQGARSSAAMLLA